MKKISFTKMVGSGNDFVVIDAWRLKGIRLPELAKSICDRKFGVGADGVLVVDKSKPAGVKMRIFNADGSEAEMCGNGARCTILYAGRKKAKLFAMAGTLDSELAGDNVRIKLTDPKELKEDMPVKVNVRLMRINFINTGVPHAVIFVEGLDKIDVKGLGSQIRNHKAFAPRGTNVNFVEVVSPDFIRIRTYERGVEDETLACGTGSVASSLITSLKCGCAANSCIRVETRSREVLKVYFDRKGKVFSNVWLEGKARIVHKGEYYV